MFLRVIFGKELFDYEGRSLVILITSEKPLWERLLDYLDIVLIEENTIYLQASVV